MKLCNDAVTRSWLMAQLVRPRETPGIVVLPMVLVAGKASGEEMLAQVLWQLPSPTRPAVVEIVQSASYGALERSIAAGGGIVLARGGELLLRTHGLDGGTAEFRILQDVEVPRLPVVVSRGPVIHTCDGACIQDAQKWARWIEALLAYRGAVVYIGAGEPCHRLFSV